MSTAGGRLTCAECAEQLYEYLDQELSPALERAIAAHLEECANCLGRFTFERAFLAVVARRGGSAAIPAQLRDRILRSIRGQAAPERG